MKCNRCGKEKSDDEMTGRKKKTKECKKCTSERARIWYRKNSKKHSERNMEWAKNNPERIKAIQKKCRIKNAEKYNAKQKIKRDERKRIVFEHYGGKSPKCSCCGEKEIKFLSMDHINGGGSKHRKEKNFSNIYYQLIKEGFPEGFEILCYNCNLAKGFFGKCPHKKQ